MDQPTPDQIDAHRALVKRAIHNNAAMRCAVTFTKKDGTVRRMIVTQYKMKALLKGDEATESGKQAAATRAQTHPNLMPVYDDEAGGIRSIDLDTVSDFEIILKEAA